MTSTNEGSAPEERQVAGQRPGQVPMQRLRLTFSQQGVLRYVGHLDMVRTWERALRRAGTPLAYSAGYNPQARLFFAAALPLGATGRCEIVDVLLTEAMAPDVFVAQVGPHLPEGLTLAAAAEAPLKTPALQSALRASEWHVDVQTVLDAVVLNSRIQDFLAQESVPTQRTRKGRSRPYDLRALVLDLRYCGPVAPGWHRLCMTLRSEPSATGRPDAVLEALQLNGLPVRPDRQRCIFDESA